MSTDEDAPPLGATMRTPSSEWTTATLLQLPMVGLYEPGHLLGRGGNTEQLERFVREEQVQGQLQRPSIGPVPEAVGAS